MARQADRTGVCDRFSVDLREERIGARGQLVAASSGERHLAESLHGEFIEQRQQRLCGSAGDTAAAHRSFDIAPGNQFLWRHLQSLRQGTEQRASSVARMIADVVGGDTRRGRTRHGRGCDVADTACAAHPRSDSEREPRQRRQQQHNDQRQTPRYQRLRERRRRRAPPGTERIDR